MAVNLVSPGVKIREIDLTIGRLDASTNQIAAFAAPFQKGPVELPVLIQTERQLLEVFGKPSADNGQSSYWFTASNFLSYGGGMRIVRADSNITGRMTNAFSPAQVGVGSTGTVKIKSVQDYINKQGNDYEDGDYTNVMSLFNYCSKNPGTWGNSLTVYAIDSAADQIISGISTNSVTVTTTEFDPDIENRSGNVVGGASTITGITTTSIQLGQVVVCDTPSILSTGTTVTGIGASTVLLSSPISSTVLSGSFTFDFGALNTVTTTTGIGISVGYGVSITIDDRQYAGIGNTETFNGYLKGIITGVGNSSLDVKLISRHSDEGGEEFIEYSDNNLLASIQTSDVVKIINPSNSTAIATFTSYTLKDWYNQQTIKLGNNTVYWKNIGERPKTSQYTLANGGKNDEINIIVVDDDGKISGNKGEVLERFIKLSKATDGRISPAQSTYYKDYLRDNSNYIFAGTSLEGVASRFSGIDNYSSYSSGVWDGLALNRAFDVIGNKTYKLSYGTDYSNAETVDYNASIDNITEAYSIFENPAEYSIDYIISGPSPGSTMFQSQAKANYIISIAEARKDCIAFISAHENDVVRTTNSNTQTNNIIKFFNGVTSSSYAVFDAGYKYTYDRFNNKFFYLACNSDIAGLMARTAINQYPWFSPAGTSRGIINNSIKLAYNPSESQRDLLYQNKINPIISLPGQGTILYGDKTASSNVSAFDRINVRALFLTLEKTIERAARSQLFEFNDVITRTNFINIVEPYLRDVRAKRGITDYVLVCDETNNTPDIIDSNQFVADIYVQPARSINFIGLTFVATRTGISFSEVIGTV